MSTKTETNAGGIGFLGLLTILGIVGVMLTITR